MSLLHYLLYVIWGFSCVLSLLFVLLAPVYYMYCEINLLEKKRKKEIEKYNYILESCYKKMKHFRNKTNYKDNK